MHAGERPRAPFRRDDVTGMQEGLDAPEDAARPDCAPASTADA